MKRSVSLKKHLVLIFLWPLLLAACQGDGDLDLARNASQELSFPPAPALSEADVALGQQVYAENCAACHGADLEGEADWKSQNEDRSFRAPPHDASGHTWHHGDDILIEAIRLGGARLPANIGGTSTMPAYADILTDEEILAVLAYIKSSWPDDLRRIQWEQTLREQ
ncbi:MAG: cytochrome c [Anaerolinea sp.]|nr:cytochrome c [Anaerolinea sp.]